MDHFLVRIVFNHSIIIAAIIGLVRFRNVNSDYYPFLFIIWLGFLNESVSLLLIHYRQSNTVNSAIFVLLEYILILFQFYRWNGNHKGRYYLLACAGMAIWLADNVFIHSITRNNSMFRVFYSFVIVFLSIDQVNKILVFERGVLLKNAMFIICITFLFYFGCKAFVEAFNIFYLGQSNLFLQNLWIILSFVNLAANILYALAILCIPTKQKFILPY